MSRADAIALALVAALAVAAMALVLGTAYRCEVSGGTLVRGLLWFECLR